MNDFINQHPFVLPIAFFVFVTAALAVLSRLVARRSNPAVLDAALTRNQSGCMVVFGGMFALAGVVALTLITLLPLYRVWRASHWPMVFGTVHTSRLGTTYGHRGGTSYRVEITYWYRVAGHDYTGDTYDASGGVYGPYYQTDLDIVTHHPRGSTVDVYYDPADPSHAMLSTQMPAGSFSFLWFPAIFIAVGTFVVVRSWQGRHGPVLVVAAGDFATSSTTMHSRRLAPFVGILLFSAAWCAIVVFLVRSHAPLEFPIVFGLIAAVLLVAAGNFGLRLFNPGIVLTFAKLPLRPGEQTEVTYRLTGNFAAIETLSVSLECREWVTTKVNGRSKSQRRVVSKTPVVEVTRRDDLAAGRFKLAVPADAKPSSRGMDQAFSWAVSCHGKVPKWPDIQDEFVIPVAARASANEA